MQDLQILKNRVENNLTITPEQIELARKDLNKLSELVRQEELKLLTKPVEGQTSLEF